jgi:hypothetical protein
MNPACCSAEIADFGPASTRSGDISQELARPERHISSDALRLLLRKIPL